MNTVIIIGAGASGIMAAISAARAGAKVFLLEHNDRMGKKILSTGNGRCNFTNIVQEPQFYRSEDPSFGWGIVKQFTAHDTIRFFQELGIYSKNRNGYMYPYSDQASAVLNALRAEIERLGVEVLLGMQTEQIDYQKKIFTVRTNKGIFKGNRLILATGGQAAPVTGSDGSGYGYAHSLGHTLVPVVPALVQLRCRENFYPQLAGIRVTGSVSVYVNGILAGQDQGEIQLTKYGISGIPVFQISRYAAKGFSQGQKVYCMLDLMLDFKETELVNFLQKRVQYLHSQNVTEFFNGLFHKALGSVLFMLCQINKKKAIGLLSEAEIVQLAATMKNFRTEIVEVNPFDQAQVCAGGVSTHEINSRTLESQLVKGLYLVGEILDVDGICGGYNLQWAWSSGYVAGKGAALHDSSQSDQVKA